VTSVLDLNAALASCAPPPGADGEALLDAWRDARDDALDAYRAWRASSRYRAAEAFAVYLAADDREAAAAQALARWVDQQAAPTHSPSIAKEAS
jgi:hypothetical protein